MDAAYYRASTPSPFAQNVIPIFGIATLVALISQLVLDTLTAKGGTMRCGDEYRGGSNTWAGGELELEIKDNTNRRPVG